MNKVYGPGYLAKVAYYIRWLQRGFNIEKQICNTLVAINMLLWSAMIVWGRKRIKWIKGGIVFSLSQVLSLYAVCYLCVCFIAVSVSVMEGSVATHSYLTCRWNRSYLLILRPKVIIFNSVGQVIYPHQFSRH